MVDLPGRGRTFVIDVPGPTPDAPAVVLLHALGCTAHLSWALALGELSQHHRVITLDQRWHGRGIRSPRFRFADCADDVAAVMDELGVERAVIAGYSMGGAIAQLMWRQHPERVAGLVLCSTARNYRGAQARDGSSSRCSPPRCTRARRARAHPRRAAGRDAAGGPVPGHRRPGRLGQGGVPQHQCLVDAGGARRARPVQLGGLDRRGRRTDRGRGDRHATTPSRERRQRRLAACIEGATVLRGTRRTRLDRARCRHLAAACSGRRSPT